MGNRITNDSKAVKNQTAISPKYTKTQFTFEKKQRCLNGIAINGECIYLAEGGNQEVASISVFSYSGDFVTRFSNYKMIFPKSIEIHRDNIYVTDTKAHAVFHFGEIEGFSISCMVGGKGSADTQFNCPTQLSVATNGEVYVADRYNDRVQILDRRLGYVRSITHPTIVQPIDVKSIKDEVIVLSYSDSYYIHTFSATGGKTTYNLNSMHQINSVQLGPMGSIIMSGASSNQIKLFSYKGELLQEIEVKNKVSMATTITQESSIGIISQKEAKYGLEIISPLQMQTS